jgi:predicted ABC-type transport system involved in lysophospholipase L1 biosynthesis ATPase subunit
MQSNSSIPSLIELRDVVKVYATAAGEFSALKGINMQVDRGEFVGVIGKSGAGKSTLLNMITGVDHLTSGEVVINANGAPVSIHKMREDEIALWRGHNLGVFQSFQLLPMLTLVENIMRLLICVASSIQKQSRACLRVASAGQIESHADKFPHFWRTTTRWPSPAPWQMTLRFSLPTSRPAVWILSLRIMCLKSLNIWSAIRERPLSW